MANCGIGGCAATEASCAATITTMTINTLSSALSITAMVLSVGTAAPVTAASSTAIKEGTSKIGEQTMRTIAANV